MRKGSLQLSINAIVILILAVTLLGVGIFFINNVLKDVLTDFQTVPEAVKEALLEDLRENVDFAVRGIIDGQLELRRGDTGTVYVGIKNPETRLSGHFKVTVTQDSQTANGNDISFLLADRDIVILPEDVAVVPIQFDAGASTGTGLFTIQVEACAEGSSPNPQNNICTNCEVLRTICSGGGNNNPLTGYTAFRSRDIFVVVR